jgi:hypothetical protein
MAKTLSYQHRDASESKVWSITWKESDTAFESLMSQLAQGFGVAANTPEFCLVNGFRQAMQDSIAGKKKAEGVESLEAYLDSKLEKIVTGTFGTRGPRIDPVTKFARDAVSSKHPKLEGEAFDAKVESFIAKHRVKIEAELKRRNDFELPDESDDEIVTPKKAKK